VRVFLVPTPRRSLPWMTGDTLAYQKGEFLRVHFTCETASDHVNFRIRPRKAPILLFKDVQLTVYGADKVRAVVLDGKPVKNWKAGIRSCHPRGIPWTSAAHGVHPVPHK